jgi:hypothetical protein
MAVSTGYDYGIRKGLVDKGINNSDIDYNKSSGYVTIKGKDAIKAPKVYNGTSFTNEQDFNNDWNTYQKSLSQAAGQVSPGQVTPAQTTQNTSYNPYQTNNPYDSQYNDLLKTLMSQAQNPVQVDVNSIYASPQYAAYQAQAQRGAQQGIRAAQESMGAAGFGRSTALGERAQGIQNSANEYLNTQVLPQLIAAEQNARQQQLQNQFSVLDALMAQQGVYDNRYNNANNLAISQGQLTGNYLDHRASDIIGKILQDKQNYATADEATRKQLTADADAQRALLAAMGIDPSLFGANQTLEQAQANMSKAGVKTLGERVQDMNEAADKRNAEIDAENRKLDAAYKQADITGVIGPVLGQIYGLPANTPTQAAMQSNRNYALDKRQVESSIANAGADNSRQAENARVSRLETIWKATGRAPAGLEEYGVMEGDPYNQGSSSGNPKYDQTPEWGQEIAALYADPQGSYDDYIKNKDDYISQYGSEGYANLLKQAKSLIEG